MKNVKFSAFASALIFSLLTTGCATNRELSELRADVDALRQLTEQASGDASQALQDTRLLGDEMAAVRLAAESASSDAAANRKMLEQMSDRLGGSKQSSFK